MTLSLPRLLLPMAATALLAGTLRAKDGLPPPVVPEGFGVNIHFTDPAAGEMERFAEGGFKWVRMDFHWEGVEREPGKYDFSAYDRLVGHLDKVGARAYFIFDYGHRRYDEGLSPHTPEGRAAFAAFAKAGAAHFKGRKVIWEIWNEPNISFWKPQPNADDYAKLANETARAVHAGDPDAFIMAPASSAFPWDFFETLFASGILEHIDAVSVHPYRESHPETAAEDYGRLRSMIARYASPGRRMLPIVSGEWGYSTAEKRFSEDEQARYIVREYLSNLANGVNLSIFYDWKDDGPDPKENEHRFGTVHQDLSPKPSFLAAKRLMQTLRGYGYRHRLQGANSAEWKLLFQKKADGSAAIVSWTTDANAPDAARTPSIRLVKNSDPDAADLRTLAAIVVEAGPLVEGRDAPPKLQARINGSQPKAAELEFRVAGTSEKLPATSHSIGGVQTVELSLPAHPMRTPRRDVPLEISYKGRPLPALAALQVWRIDPLSLAVAPRGSEFEAVIANPSKLPFRSRLVARNRDGEETASAVVAIGKGEAEGRASLEVKASEVDFALVDADGAAVVEPISGRFERLLGPSHRDMQGAFEAVLFVDNAATPGKPLEASMTSVGGRSERTLQVPFRFDPGWRYLGVQPRRPLPIPAKAREVLFWIKGDDSHAYLRCRIRDASGQTFQPDLGRLDGDGWRIVRIPLDGSAPGGHWGGAGDGVPHLPLAWESVLLLDSPDRDKGGSGSLLFASPSYRMDR
ncbi:cellulase family glycosylhydrolase [Paludisphaera mucosa]|uniref:Cellulase family glycosylhydrolase n=1 Tax=Paludisphaera mucosa TaxID=3030827 RepID=A0ABT6FH91_9BACT|nr:cellulase family glycosylhydrolase [Paludisphaera mucosa]MDG3006930.1 cellulase family glycosylhydrolase [Paludisphaera mucosa]